MAELVNQTLCTWEDLERSEERLTQRIYGIEVKVGTVEKGLEVKIGAIEKNLEVKVESLRKDLVLHIIHAKHEMIKWLIGKSIAGLSFTFTMIRFLI